MSFILCICFFFLLENKRAFSQMDSVYVGDTVISRSIDGPQPPQTCVFGSMSFTHHIGSDFYVLSDYVYGHPITWGPFGNIMFAPQKIGLQRDTFFVAVGWAFNRSTDCGPEWHGGPFLSEGLGISDSIILFRSLNPYNLVAYSWNLDSNKYFGLYAPPNNIGLPQPIELVNNVETSTQFEFSLTVDPSAPVHPIISIEGDSSSFPKSYLLGPKLRRRRGFIYFFTDSKGFKMDTSFIAMVRVILHNPTFTDTTTVKYKLRFTAKPLVSVSSMQGKKIESILIISNIGSHYLNITSNFSQPENTSLELYDALGRQLPLPISQLQIPSGTSSQKLEVGNLSSGCYILRMKMKDQVISKSFVITR